MCICYFKHASYAVVWNRLNVLFLRNYCFIVGIIKFQILIANYITIGFVFSYSTDLLVFFRFYIPHYFLCKRYMMDTVRMDTIRKMKLQTLRENIVQDVKVDEVFDYLLSRGVLSEGDMQRIKGEVSLKVH